jgi:hypothetical protein
MRSTQRKQALEEPIEFISGAELSAYFATSIATLEAHLAKALEKGESPNQMLVNEIQALRRDAERYRTSGTQ